MTAIATGNAKEVARPPYRRAAWVLALLFPGLALVTVAVPVWIIRPFESQSPDGLRIAYALREWSPAVTALAAVVAIAATVFLWRGAKRWWRRGALLLFAAAALGCAWFARQNHFEWMFNPLPDASYARASDARFVEAGDKVMAVEINGESVAYPVRQLAYHHLVQDTVGGTPVVVTY